MPELPDLEVYLGCLRPRLVGRRLEAARLASPFLLRSIEPPLAAAHGRPVRGVERLGKRLVFAFEGELFFVLHLMIAGRLWWRGERAKIPPRRGLAAFDFGAHSEAVPPATLLLTEAGSKKRASLFVVAGREALGAHDPGGIEVLTSSREEFRRAICRERHTLKRTLTDPHILAGIGNAYSDEILHRARLSPFKLTDALGEEELTRLWEACRSTLSHWTARLRDEVGDGFPEKVTAFREGMAVHGRFRRPCPVCGAAVQRIVYAENEANYCATCQTGGRLLADRALSRLLRQDWPRTVDELERRRRGEA